MTGPVETSAIIGYPFAPQGELRAAVAGQPAGKTTVESQHLVDLVVVTAPWFQRFTSEVAADFQTLWFDYSDAGPLLSPSSYWLGTWFPSH